MSKVEMSRERYTEFLDLQDEYETFRAEVLQWAREQAKQILGKEVLGFIDSGNSFDRISVWVNSIIPSNPQGLVVPFVLDSLFPKTETEQMQAKIDMLERKIESVERRLLRASRHNG